MRDTGGSVAGGQEAQEVRRGVDAVRFSSPRFYPPPCLSFYGCSTARHVITRCAAAARGVSRKEEEEEEREKKEGKRRNENSARTHEEELNSTLRGGAARSAGTPTPNNP